MYVWEIACRTIDEPGSAVFRVSSFGHVLNVDPATSVFASMRLDVEGFVEPGTILHGDRPELLAEDVLRSGQDVTGKALALRGEHMTFVAAAIVVSPIRLISTQ